MIKRHLKSFTAAALALVLALSAVGCGKKAAKPVAKTADSSDKPAFNIDISGNKKDAAAVERSYTTLYSDSDDQIGRASCRERVCLYV